MHFSRRIEHLERRGDFQAPAERQLFRQVTVRDTRSLATAIQGFGWTVWLVSVLLRHPPSLDMVAVLIAGLGMPAAMALTWSTRGPVANGLARCLYIVFLTLGLKADMLITSAPIFWVLPLGAAITVGMSPIYTGLVSYALSAAAVWGILLLGQFEALLRTDDADWVMLFLLSVMALGVTLNLLFRHERQRIFLSQRELARLAFRDGLTDLHNRRSFMLAVDEHLQHNPGRGHLVLVDVDDFKQVNDRHGHDTGDQVLTAVAQAIARCAEPQVCGRLGGEEFGVLLTADADPAAFGRRLCETVAGLSAAGLPITISVGIAPFQAEEPISVTFRTADDALYRAKRQGKNRSLLAEPASCCPRGSPSDTP
ncbi:GGDEF domain-containing protein [Ideonella oryzae]|uniref:diguanylate cyclase n=1 Tax=Ideonella oryzae TaxID=2937441 RepID=A0ABT1BT08_9BURK|nr:GGDEF domain-containing protein [Ideonella oryzae]MCO5978974.1 GGDEF domain-containing protein [Ideonella oryzae]